MLRLSRRWSHFSHWLYFRIELEALPLICACTLSSHRWLCASLHASKSHSRSYLGCWSVERERGKIFDVYNHISVMCVTQQLAFCIVILIHIKNRFCLIHSFFIHFTFLFSVWRRRLVFMAPSVPTRSTSTAWTTGLTSMSCTCAAPSETQSRLSRQAPLSAGGCSWRRTASTPAPSMKTHTSNMTGLWWPAPSTSAPQVADAAFISK